MNKDLEKLVTPWYLHSSNRLTYECTSVHRRKPGPALNCSAQSTRPRNHAASFGSEKLTNWYNIKLSSLPFKLQQGIHADERKVSSFSSHSNHFALIRSPQDRK